MENQKRIRNSQRAISILRMKERIDAKDKKEADQEAKKDKINVIRTIKSQLTTKTKGNRKLRKIKNKLSNRKKVKINPKILS